MLAVVFSTSALAQELYPPKLPDGNWHGEQRELRYRPEGRDFVIRNGKRRFTRALYGTNTAFRVEAGDLPEFALYMPGMGGNLKFGLIGKNGNKWLINASNISARYRPGSMLYHITDPLLGNGHIELDVLALHKGEGLIVKVRFKNVTEPTQFFWAFGGASGKNFSRSGDMGPDPESVFYLQPQNCKGNVFTVQQNTFSLKYGKDKELRGIFPSKELRVRNADQQDSPTKLEQSTAGDSPVLTGKFTIANERDFFFLIENPQASQVANNLSVAQQFVQAESARKAIANRIIVDTPDPYINTIGGALSIAADAIWEEPSYLHGAVGWRMRLNGWRGAYAADALGWHDRARMHFNAYAKSQVITPPNGPVVADTALNLARSKEAMGTAMFSSGYISREPNGKSLRPHHYDMNLVFIDQLLWHLNWTGDLAYAKEIWPMLVRHLEWEKRTFDPDQDGLYDAYAAIWASDALQYSGGAVTHTSAYNYRANVMAAKIAKLISLDPTPYQREADKILAALNTQLWMPQKGWFAEYKDALGLQQLHPAAALWTIYHAIDSDVPDAFQAWQSLRYIDTELPHIPVRAKGLADQGFYTVATTNWMPYEWSLNNVVLAESTHTALANWQSGRTEEAFKLWKSEMLASMYLGGSPGNFVQISHYDANRAEAYRDFADPVGINARALVEGLFGIVPNALDQTLHIRPGFPMAWQHAAIHTPDVDFSYRANKLQDTYQLHSRLKTPLALKLKLKARKSKVLWIKVNGRLVNWKNVDQAIGTPELLIEANPSPSFKVEVQWGGNEIEVPKLKQSYQQQETLAMALKEAKAISIFDPQKICGQTQINGANVKVSLVGEAGNKTLFIRLKNGAFTYWFPLCFELKANGKQQPVIDLTASQWQGKLFEKIDLSAYFNDQVTQIFNNRYLSPRPKTTTLQLPVQGIGDWPHPNVKPEIDDSGLRQLAGLKNEITLPSGISFATPGNKGSKNIVFTAQWDNYPDSISIPLAGQAKTIFFLLAGSTNPMQSRMDNGLITVTYADGATEKLPIRNPENWWPIEKNMFLDGAAFDTKAPIPLRIHLKTGQIISNSSFEAWNGKEIKGGAATALGLALDANKKLSKITLSTRCNDVVIGLMAVSLQR